jgi:hypothetical protein
MTRPEVWRTDEPCPVCQTGLFIIGFGELIQVIECRLCGWSDTWDLTSDETSEMQETGGGGE